MHVPPPLAAVQVQVQVLIFPAVLLAQVAHLVLASLLVLVLVLVNLLAQVQVNHLVLVR